MSDARSLSGLAAPIVVSRSERPIRHARPIVAVVDRLSPRWAADHLVAALEGRGAVVARLTATLRSRAGAEMVDDHVRASPDAMPAALAEALAALPAHDLLVVEGVPAVAMLDASLSVLVSPVSVLALAPDVRALRGCFDLVLFAERTAVLDRLAAKLWPRR